MRRLPIVALSCALVGGVWLAGCAKKPAPQADQTAEPRPPAIAASVPQAVDASAVASSAASVYQPSAADPLALAAPAPSGGRENYDAAVLDAVNCLADRRYADALKNLELARSYQDTEQVRQEIGKVKLLVDQQAAADQTVRDIQLVLRDGNPQEASRLAAAALQQFGSTAAAEQLAQLKHDADAFTAAQANEMNARLTSFRQQGDDALASGNLRAAAVAFDQALQSGDDPQLRRKLDGITLSLKQYDDSRARAAELRRDPARLDDAVAALRMAAQAWDTPQVREEIDLCTLALQNRRERISVADFEIRGDIGLPGGGRTIAEELLPAFKPRFDLVERSQLYNVLNELRLEASDLAGNDNGRREVGRLARVRYLVLGSVTPLCGLTVNARLVDASTGLVVQTAKIVATTPEELLRRLPQLAAILGMTDEQKFAYEQQLANQAVVIQPVAVGMLPPPPDAAVVVAPPPILVYSPRPPDPGRIRPEDFDLLPPAGQPSLSASLTIGRENPFGGRLFQLSVELGDNLFRRGQYHEAHRQFELALSLSPGHQDIQVRIDRCRPHLPPPPPVVVAPAPALVVAPAPVVVDSLGRPRVAVLNFIVNASPTLAPPGLDEWAADQMASYYAPMYEVVDRGQVFWYMGRLGLTMRDLACDASARICLARALHVRYFAFGFVQQTASFDVTTHLVDAETGGKQASGHIHVQDHTELKLRMQELVRQTAADPAERARIEQRGKESERLINEARRLMRDGQGTQAVQVCQTALQQSPDNAALQALLQQAKQVSQEETRRNEYERAQAVASAARKQQEELARQAEAARQRAAQQAAAMDVAAKRARDQQREQAYAQLLAQGERALGQRDYQHAIQSLQGAVALNATPVATRELGEARRAAQESARAQAADEAARRKAEQDRQRDLELQRAKAVAEAERRQKEAEEQTHRAAQAAADQAVRAKLMNQGQASQAKQPAPGHADIVRQTPGVASAPLMAPAAPASNATAIRLPTPSATADSRPPVIQRPVQATQPKPIPRPSPEALAQAHPLFAQPGMTHPAVPAQPPAPSPSMQPPVQPSNRPNTVARPQPANAASNGSAEYARQIQAGANFYGQRKYAEAVRAYQEAVRLKPGDAQGATGLHLAQGRVALQTRRFADAAREFQAALALVPNQPEAMQGLKQAQQGKP